MNMITRRTPLRATHDSGLPLPLPTEFPPPGVGTSPTEMSGLADGVGSRAPSRPGGVASGPSKVLARRAAGRGGRSWLLWRASLQVALAAAFLAGWQFLPKIHFLARHFRVLDPFYVSSPTQVWTKLRYLIAGDPQTGMTMWPYLRTTVGSTVEGTVVGLLLGAVAGLLFSNNERLGEIVRPFIILANSVPRVAIIPISVVLFGPTPKASVFNVITVVFFVGFFNAFEGGRSIKPAILDNAALLGANSFSVMRSIRLPMVLTWTFAAVPNAISFGLVVAVTTELLAGIQGMGVLLQTATSNVQTATTFAIIVALSVVGLVLYFCAILLRRLLIRWED
jgi:NitT/TauT family transport system permease protein